MSPELVRGIFDVLSLSSILILLVIGMAIIVGMMKVFNMCQGELVLLGAVTAFLCSTYLGNLWIGILLAPIVVGIFGLFLERTIIHRFYINPQVAHVNPPCSATSCTSFVLLLILAGVRQSSC